MNSDVEAILNLQTIDLEILKVRNEVSGIPASIESIEKEKKVFEQEWEVYLEGTKKQRLQQKNIDGEIEAKKEKLKKLETQLNSIKTNAEYSLMLKEIAAVKDDIYQTEDRLLDLMEVLERLDEEVAGKKQEIQQKKNAVDERVGQLKLEQQEQEKQLNQLLEDRKAAIQKCSGELYDRYQRFIDKKKTIALVPVEKNGTCGGCHRNLPPNIRNEVMKNKIIQCDNCSRLLFWDGSNKEEQPGEEKADNAEASES